MAPFFGSFLRWLLFLPAAYGAAWLVTRMGMLLVLMNPVLATIVTHAASGAVIGYVGVVVAPNFKRIALALCCLLSLLIAVVYFRTYNDVLGGLSAAAHVIATIVAGFMAVEDTSEPKIVIRANKEKGKSVL
jgi:hypothetical protein